MVGVPNSISEPCGWVIAGALAVGLLTGCSADGRSGSGQYVGFELKGGEEREILATPFYRSMRVCNHTDSAGSITATIDNNIQHELAPGVCVEDPGGSVRLRNLSNGEARGDYRIEIAQVPPGYLFESVSDVGEFWRRDRCAEQQPKAEGEDCDLTGHS